ncbi:U-box domain-containing protein kinase family protein, putative isoform 1 [Hibiscus syriacus]|uniref:U-box domain-containing protein kinase family protein, putative isoform 1 n=1 Tax=Hibiscus syriacus TaxID=106335 RepID=A0A6A2WRC0_HIBSY|nr:U-box domain-containing protein kinase family protein, putative isoform 1 [Hibiscus syriacus]
MASLLSSSAAISFQYKLNRSSLSALSANTPTPSKISHAFPGNGRCQRLSFETKATGSVEGNVVDKESTGTSDKIVSCSALI